MTSGLFFNSRVAIVYLIAYFVGFKLRPLIPKGKGFGMGFSITMVLLVVLVIIGVMFPPVGNLRNAMGTAFAIGVGHGIMFMDSDKKKIPTDKQDNE